jgi:hypothetical protein
MASVDEIHDLLEDLDTRLSGLEGQSDRPIDPTKIPVATENWLLIPYRFLAVPPGVVAGANPTLISRTIAMDGPFDLMEITHTAINQAVPPVANNNFQFVVREGRTVSRPLTQDAIFVDAATASGTAQRPYIIKGRRRFRANSALVVEIVNTDAFINDIEIVLHGIKVFSQ